MKTNLSTATKVVIAGLLSLFSTRAQATLISGTGAVDAFYTPDDGFGHAIIAQTNSGQPGATISEIWFDGTNYHPTPLINWNATTVEAVTGYYSSNDGHRHAVFATSQGQIWDYEYSPSFGHQLNILTTFAPSTYGTIVAMSSFFDPNYGDTGSDHIVVATNTGKVLEYVNLPGNGYSYTQTIANFAAGDIVDVAAYYNAFYEHVVVGTRNYPYDFYQATNNEGSGWSGFSALTAENAHSEIGFGAFAPNNNWGGTDKNDVMFCSSTQLLDYAWVSSYSSVNWEYTFTYGPTVRSVGAYYDPRGTYGTKHTITAMSNGDLWDMYQTSPNGNYSWHYWGTY
jgi:hypothetical protein